MSENRVERILSQTRESVALTKNQVMQMGEMSRIELSALSVVLSRWRVNLSVDSMVDRPLLRKPRLPDPSKKVSSTPTLLYEQVKRGEKIQPEQIAAIVDWSVPDLLSLVVRLQADLVGSPVSTDVKSAQVKGLGRKSGNWRSHSGTRKKRHTSRMAIEHWFRLVLLISSALALAVLGSTSAGWAIVHVAAPLLIGAASIWLFTRGRWLSQSKRYRKASAGRAAMMVSVVGFLVAAGWVLFVALSASLTIGSIVMG